MQTYKYVYYHDFRGVHQSNAVLAVSYLAMQTYKYVYYHNFHGVHQSNAVLQVFSFVLAPFLYQLNGVCNLSLNSCTQDTNTQIFHQLNVTLQDILKDVKAWLPQGGSHEYSASMQVIVGAWNFIY